MNLPVWWVEAIAIEYTDCREYGVGDNGIWKINLERVQENELEDALINHKTVISGCILFHNVRHEVVRTRMIESLVSGVPAALTTDCNSGIVEGQASDYYFPFSSNGIDIVDPKQELDQYFHVYENGELWQWKFADFTSVEGRNYGKFVSEYVSLEKFDEKYEKYHELWNEKHINKECDTLMKIKIDEYFKWIDSIRKPLLKQLYELHLQKKASPDYISKATEDIPPYLSRFESYQIATDNKGKNNIYIKIQAAPIFYQSCCQHVRKANEITLSISTNIELPPRLDAIYQEKASAIVTGIMCLEAFINQMGYDMLSDIWGNQEKLALSEKIQVILALKGTGSGAYNTSIEPLSTFINCVTSRNWLVHLKAKYEPIKYYKMKRMTPIEYYLRDDLVFSLPSKIKEIIEYICKDVKINAPAWLYEAPGWSFK
jgi:hypothetical protein